MNARPFSWPTLVEGLNHSELARRFGRSRETIGGVLKGEAFETTKKEVQQGITDEARLILQRHMVPAAVAWGRTLGIASEKGDHRPAKALLLHTKAIEPPKADQTYPARRPIAHPPDVPCQPDLGCPTHPRRVAEARHHDR